MPKVNLKVPKRSGFDKSHKHLLTAKCGTLIPVLCDELIPNTKVSLKSAIEAALPPLAADTFMRVNLKLEAFFVPTRLLYGGFERWICAEDVTSMSSSGNSSTDKPIIPRVHKPISTGVAMFESGTLMDYLGLKSTTPVSSSSGSYAYFNIFPFLAYHRIYDDWYRNTKVQAPVFTPAVAYSNTLGSQLGLSSLPYYVAVNRDGADYMDFYFTSQFNDKVQLGDLRQRNFGFDYFTTAQPSAQRGNVQAIQVDGNQFTISALRAANSLQQFAERNQLAGNRLQDYVKANYGADLSTGVAQRAIYLGSGDLPVYNKGVFQQANGTGVSPNPLAQTVGAKFGSADVNGSMCLVEDFTAQEPGYLMVMASLVPYVTYSAGIRRMYLHYNAQDSQTDMANPLLQNVGNQPIYAQELTGLPNDTSVFGYTDRFAEYKYINDSLSGLVRDGESLQSFALQRTLTGNPEIGSDFLEIPTDFFDNVTAVNAAMSNYGYWADFYFDYKVSMPLSQYAIPSLQDPAFEHGDDVYVDVNGQSL